MFPNSLFFLAQSAFYENNKLHLNTLPVRQNIFIQINYDLFSSLLIFVQTTFEFLFLYLRVFETQQELAAYKEEDVALAGLILSSEMIQQTNPESSRDVIDCLGRAAFGISIAEWALTGRITATMGIRLLGQVARRALGPIAVAFVIYDFVDCMTSYSSTATTGPSEATTDSTKTIPPTEAFVNQTTH